MGFFELLLIVVVVLLFFGAGKLPALGEGLGKAIRGFKESVRSDPPPERGAQARQLPPAPEDPKR